jgi:hypothetical protein
VRAKVGAATGIDQRSIWLIATHTHSGPPSDLTLECNALERDYVASLPERIARAALVALRSVEAIDLTVSRGHANVGDNRRHIVDGLAVMEPAPGRPLDNDLFVLEARRKNGSILASLVVAGCHPVCVGRDNLTVGGDYPGKLCRAIEGANGGIALFAMGAAGDVNPTFGLVPDQTAAQKTAGILLDEVQSARENAVSLDHSLAVEHFEGNFPVSRSLVDRGLNTPPEIDHLAQVKGWRWPEIDQLMDRRHPWHPALPGNYHEQDDVPGEIGVARVGDVALVALPFEVFSAVGQAIKSASPFSNTIIIGQANGALGYLAPAEEHSYGGYEIRESCLFYRTRGPLSPEATDRAISRSVALLTALRDARP